jgi:hypothetical protein
LWVHKFCHTTVGHETCQKKYITHKQNKWTQYNKKMSIQESPKSNTVHNIIIKYKLQ